MKLITRVLSWVLGQHITLRSFIGIHYIYIIGIAIIGSICVYPMRNMAYIDALFMATGAVTQAGLNTVNLNNIALYQQVILCMECYLTSIIFIHTGVVFFRLWSFEKHFKNIARNAKMQSRLRRTATKAKRKESSGQADIESGIMGFIHSAGKKNHSISRNTVKTTLDTELKQVDNRQNNDPSSSSSSAVAPESYQPPQDRDIKFGDLPQPSRRDNDDVAPEDMFRSLYMMQRNRRKSSGSADGPALVIPGPRDMPDDNRPVIDDSSFRNWTRRTKSFGDVAPNHGNERASSMDSEEDNRGHSLMQIVRSKTIDHLASFGTMDNREIRPTMSTNYLSWEPTVGRNSAFIGLTDAQKEELGGVEYKSLKLLSKILVGFYIGFHIFGVVALIPWIWKSQRYRDYVRKEGINPSWWAIFTAMSAFNDLGFTLTEESMAPFIDAVYPQLLMSFLIIIGNTGFPCILRFIIWVMFKLTPEFGQMHESLGFLLDHPRRCFTLLFPPAATWWLFAVLVMLNGIDLIFFIILDIHNRVLEAVPVGFRISAGFFQAVSTRTAGFSIVSLAALSPAIKVSYTIMMYISVFPIAISVRRTNVYEEQSLGIYGDEEDTEHPSHVVSHLRKQLSFDLWFIALGLFIICIAETSRIDAGNFTIFDVMFEVVSAYCTVGLSLGYPNYNPSLSGQFNVIGKLVIIALAVRGRHRGLPYALDRAIILKGDMLQKVDTIQSVRARNPRQMSTLVPISDHFEKANTTGIFEPSNSSTEDGLRRRLGGDNNEAVDLSEIQSERSDYFGME